MSEQARMLPAGFESLERFVGKWAKDTPNERQAARSTAEMADIRDFYEAILDKAEAAFECIEKYPLLDQPQEVQTLSKLVLALAQASISVELHNAPRAPNAPYPNSIKIVRGYPPFG